MINENNIWIDKNLIIRGKYKGIAILKWIREKNYSIYYYWYKTLNFKI
jgi:hypothetical protein